MPKPMLKTPQQNQSGQNNILSTRQSPAGKQKTTQADKMKLDRLLRKSRSKEYMEAMRSLDAGGHVHNRAQIEKIIETIRNELPEVQLSGILLGYVSRCYLGRPYEVHTLDLTGEIIEHYQGGQALPGGLEKARSIAIRGGYEFIEVYVDCCRAVGSNGSVSVITG